MTLEGSVDEYLSKQKTCRIPNIYESYMCTAVKKWDMGDLRSYEHYWTSSWNETWKKFRSVRDLNQSYFQSLFTTWKIYLDPTL